MPTPKAQPAWRLGTAATGFEKADALRRADVDVPEDAHRVCDPEPCEKPGRRRRELPVDDDGDRGRDEEAVPEAPEAVARSVVKPEEEEPSKREVAHEVEEVPWPRSTQERRGRLAGETAPTRS
jgi:hypothetical protein